MTSDRPLLRRIDSFQFNKETAQNDASQFSKYLTNPHLSAKPSTVKNGKQSFVKGNYLYFHYMQDSFNDNGWGCAYRSFQTIFSWFILQSYTTKQIPSHRDIQKVFRKIKYFKKKIFVYFSRLWLIWEINQKNLLVHQNGLVAWK